MESLNKSGRPRLLSDIPEIDSEVSQSQHAGPPGSPHSSTEQQDSAANSSQPLVPAANDDGKSSLPSPSTLPSTLPKKPPPPAASSFIARGRRLPRRIRYPFLKVPRELQQFTKPAMDSPSASAPPSLRAERPVDYSSSPSSGDCGGVSLARASGASDILSISSSADEGNIPVSHTSSESDIHITSPPIFNHGREPYTSDYQPAVQTGKLNLKRLTCYWWYHTGNCRFSSTACLYAHEDTGHYAQAPRQVLPGQPAVAGRNADRKMREVQQHLSNLQLDESQNLNIYSPTPTLTDTTNQPFSTTSPGRTITGSRPTTPLMLRSPNAHNQPNANFPLVLNSPLYHATTNAANLENEVRFFRTLVEQNGKEKEVMVSTIESLQAENQNLRTTNTTITAETTRLTEERDALRGALSILQQNTQHSPSLSRSSTPISSLRRTNQGSASWADFGAIGGKRFGSGGSSREI